MRMLQRKDATQAWHQSCRLVFLHLYHEKSFGADICAGMYVREEDIFNAIYRQLKIYVIEHYITALQHKQEIQQFNDKIFELVQGSQKAWTNAMEHYE